MSKVRSLLNKWNVFMVCKKKFIIFLSWNKVCLKKLNNIQEIYLKLRIENKLLIKKL